MTVIVLISVIGHMVFIMTFFYDLLYNPFISSDVFLYLLE
jgi:hypothetical protein